MYSFIPLVVVVPLAVMLAVFLLVACSRYEYGAGILFWRQQVVCNAKREMGRIDMGNDNYKGKNLQGLEPFSKLVHEV